MGRERAYKESRKACVVACALCGAGAEMDAVTSARPPTSPPFFISGGGGSPRALFSLVFFVLFVGKKELGGVGGAWCRENCDSVCMQMSLFCFVLFYSVFCCVVLCCVVLRCWVLR